VGLEKTLFRLGNKVELSQVFNHGSGGPLAVNVSIFGFRN